MSQLFLFIYEGILPPLGCCGAFSAAILSYSSVVIPCLAASAETANTACKISGVRASVTLPVFDGLILDTNLVIIELVSLIA